MKTLFFLLIAPLVQANPFQDYASFFHSKEIDGLVKNVRDYNDSIRLCPYCYLAVSCGNNICDNGETERTCFEDCTPGNIRSYNNQTICPSTENEIYAPSTTKEVQKIIKNATQKGLKVKMVGRKHSDNGSICTNGITISTKNMNKVVGLESYHGVETVKVQPGVTIFELNQWLHKRDKSLRFAVVSYRSVSIGGILGTGAHGSATKETSLLSAIVESFTVVGGDGEINKYDREDGDIFKALTLNLGLLGAITEVNLRVWPQFNMEVNVTYHHEKKLYNANKVSDLFKDCEWAEIHWFPTSKRFLRSCGKTTTKEAMAGAQSVLIGEKVPTFLTNLVKGILQFGSTNPWASRLFERLRWLQFKLKPPFEVLGENGKLKATANLVGHSHMLQASEFASIETRQMRSKDLEISFPQNKILGALKATRKYFTKLKVSIPLTGLFLRFSIIDDESLLSLVTSGGDFKLGEIAMYAEWHHFKPAGLTYKEMEVFGQKHTDWVAYMVKDFGARIHWAKGKPIDFEFQHKFDRFNGKMERFQKVIDRLDPRGIFSNDFSKMLKFK